MNKIAIVTSVVGVSGFDMYTPKHANADYFLFTEQDCSFPGWTVRKLYPFSLDKKYENRRTAKIPKILTHQLLPTYNYYIWHDYTNYVSLDPEKIISDYLKDSDFAFFNHPHRNCLYDEAIEVLRSRLDHNEKINMQIKYYTEMKVKEKNNFFEATTFVRRNNDVCNKVCTFWYEHMDKFSSRDQISLPAALQEYSPKISILPGNTSIYFGNNNIIPAFRDTLRMQGKVR